MAVITIAAILLLRTVDLLYTCTVYLNRIPSRAATSAVMAAACTLRRPPWQAQGGREVEAGGMPAAGSIRQDFAQHRLALTTLVVINTALAAVAIPIQCHCLAWPCLAGAYLYCRLA